MFIIIADGAFFQSDVVTETDKRHYTCINTKTLQIFVGNEWLNIDKWADKKKMQTR